MARPPKCKPGELDQTILDCYPQGGPDAVLESLPQYTKKRIIQRAQYLGVKSNKFRKATSQEKDYIAKHYIDYGPKKIADELGWTPEAAYGVAYRMGVSRTFCTEKDDSSNRNDKLRKLDEEKVARIKLRIKDGDSDKKLAHEYGVARTTITMIRNGNTWRRVEPERPSKPEQIQSVIL